jgi:hypothetical protein
MNLIIFSNDAMTFAYCLILLFLLQRTDGTSRYSREGGIVLERQAAKSRQLS